MKIKWDNIYEILAERRYSISVISYPFLLKKFLTVGTDFPTIQNTSLNVTNLIASLAYRRKGIKFH